MRPDSRPDADGHAARVAVWMPLGGFVSWGRAPAGGPDRGPDAPPGPAPCASRPVGASRTQWAESFLKVRATDLPIGSPSAPSYLEPFRMLKLQDTLRQGLLGAPGPPAPASWPSARPPSAGRW